MRRFALILLCLTATVAALWTLDRKDVADVSGRIPTGLPKSVPSDQVSAARGVLDRLIAKRADEFELRLEPSASGLDFFEYSASGGKVTVSGSSGVAICRGTYDYLKTYCHSVVTWDGDRLPLPSALPDAPRTHVASPNRYRHYFNVCTFGYTTAFWDWPRWRREIDWMALHGINMPLAMNGQERVWQDVWRSYGLSDSEILGFFAGPAFLPWHRMGNIDSHAGPMPQSFLEHDATLQEQILVAERELGMKPVTPAFSSFVPRAFARKHPKAQIRPTRGWAGFEPTFMLDPRDALFPEIGKKFLEKYRERYGETSHLYLADVFNEMTPVVSEDHTLDDLAATGKAIYESMRAADPNAIWVMQGWLFYWQRDYWDEQKIAAYLGGVPDERMILLDLGANEYEVWRNSRAFRSKPYIWNMLHNYGQRTRLFGNLEAITNKPIRALNDPDHGRMVGMGLTMEGIEQNALIYELMLDNMWRTEPVPRSWPLAYVESRTGMRDIPETHYAIDYLGVGAYQPHKDWTLMGYQERPVLNSITEERDTTEERRAIDQLIAAWDTQQTVRSSQPLAYFGTPLMDRDFVDMAKDVIGEGIARALSNTLEAYRDGKDPTANRRAFEELMLGLDSILATVPQHRLDRWISMARACVPETDRAILERNARMQVTVWGGPWLTEYAAKEWSGLVSTYYLPRWQRLFTALDAKESDANKFDREMKEWELKWCASTDLPKPKAVDSYAETKRLLAIIDSIPKVEVDRGIAVGKPATDSGHHEQGRDPSKANDGQVAYGYWAASPAPQWWQVDLGQPETLRRVQVITYFGDGRYYQYTVQVSLDGQTWTTVADMSQNMVPAVPRGVTHEFAPVSARYVRVNMLHNSANIGLHLREVRVFR